MHHSSHLASRGAVRRRDQTHRLLRSDSIRGFTLVELIVAMVILATLAAIAIPSYNSYVLKSHRTEAKSALTDLASMEERYFSVNNSYTTVPSNLGYSQAAAPFNIGTDGYYQVQQQITVNAATAPTGTTAGSPATYLITAVAVGNQANDTACATFTISSTGQQTAQTSGGTDNSTTCWQN
jgi:type IV pilus assembly protein PilE